MKEASTKEKILVAAKQLFVAHGFAGTSVGKIAKLAGINHSLIFHHYQNKEQLWVAVKHSIAETNVNNELPDTSLHFNEFLKVLFLQNLAFYRENQDIVRMLNWQRLEGSTTTSIGVTASKKMQAWLDVIHHYQTQGDIKSSLNTAFIVTLILSIISSAALDPNVYIASKEDEQAYLDFCIEALQKALL